jgi:hypothetical protein
MTLQAGLWALATGLLGLAVAAAFAEHRRANRRNLDDPGFVPWGLIQIMAAIGALAAAALAVQA